MGSGFCALDSGLRFEVRGFRFQNRDFRFQVSGFRFQVSGFRIQDSGSRCEVSSTECRCCREGKGDLWFRGALNSVVSHNSCACKKG